MKRGLRIRRSGGAGPSTRRLKPGSALAYAYAPLTTVWTLKPCAAIAVKAVSLHLLVAVGTPTSLTFPRGIWSIVFSRFNLN